MRTGGEPKEGLSRVIWANSWPMLGIMVLNFLVGYTDIYVAGLLSPDAQAAVGFASQQFFVLIILGNALSIGTVAVVSNAYGRGDWPRVLDLLRQTLVLACALGGILAILTFALAGGITGLFDLPESVRPVAASYLRILALAIFPNYVILLLAAVFRAVSFPVAPLFIMAAVAALNVLGDFGLAFGFGPVAALGTLGIAASTAVSMLAGLGVAVVLLRRARFREAFAGPWRIVREDARAVVRVGWPAAVLQVAWNAGALVLYTFLAGLGGESVTAMAAFANGTRIEAVTFLPAFALNMAAAVLVGQRLGAGSAREARRVGWRMAWWGAGAISVVSAVLFIEAERVGAFLTPDPAVLAETVRYLRVNLPVAPVMVVSVVLGGAMQGAGDTLGVMKVILIAIWGLRIPLAWALVHVAHMGALGVWVAMVASMVLQGVLMINRFRGGAWHGAAPPA